MHKKLKKISTWVDGCELRFGGKNWSARAFRKVRYFTESVSPVLSTTSAQASLISLALALATPASLSTYCLCLPSVCRLALAAENEMCIEKFCD